MAAALILLASLAAAAVAPPPELLAAAEAGDAAAQLRLAELYAKSVTTDEPEFEQTFLWFVRARTQHASTADERTRQAALEADRRLKLVKRYIPREAREAALKLAFPTGEAPAALIDDRLKALDSERPEQRHQAARDLGDLGEFHALGSRRNAVVDKLLPFLKGKDLKMQSLALEALQEIGRHPPPKAAPPNAPQEKKP